MRGGAVKVVPEVLHYVHPAFRIAQSRGEQVEGHRAFVLVKIERIPLTPYVLVTTRDGKGRDMAEAEKDARANFLSNLVWTFRHESTLELVGVAIPHSGMSIEPDPEPRVWVKRHVFASRAPEAPPIQSTPVTAASLRAHRARKATP